jgi:hypothetical protein
VTGYDGKADGDNGPDGILVVVDEADLWPWRKLLRLFHDAPAWQSHHVRVLMAARASGKWWDTLRAELSPLEITSDQLRLEPLNPADTRKLAEVAGRSFAKDLRWDEPSPLPPEVFDKLAGSPPLSVELIVLGRVIAQHSGQPEPRDMRAAVEVILEKELRYWSRMYSMEPDGGQDPHRILVNPGFMARVVYVATLTGPLGYTVAEQVVDLARIGCSLDAQLIIDDHARCYPPTDDNLCLAPLPSCVAEEFLGLLIPDPERETSLLTPDPWATTIPFHLLGLVRQQPFAI